jgi:glutaredoxin
MYLLIGKKNCSRCEIIKNILLNKNINYKYKLFEDLSSEEKNRYIKLAKKNNQMEFPLIIKNNQIIDFKEVV